MDHISLSIYWLLDLEILKYKFIYCDCAGGSLGPESSLVVVCGLSCPVARGMLVL